MRIIKLIWDIVFPYEIEFESGPWFPRFKERLFAACYTLRRVGMMVGLF